MSPTNTFPLSASVSRLPRKPCASCLMSVPVEILTNSFVAGTRAATRLLVWSCCFLAGGCGFFVELTDNRNQTVDLRLVQGPSKGRHVSFPLINLSEDFSVGEFLGFG